MIVDIVVLIVLFISAFIAFLRGFIREVLTIAGVLGGMAAAYVGGPVLAPFMRGWFGVEEGVEPDKLFGLLPYNIVADGLSYISIFILVVLVLSLISHMMAETARSMGMGAVDRTLGVVFGLVRGILLLGLLYLPVYLMVDKKSSDEFFDTSRTHFYLEKTAGWMAGFLPEDTIEDLNSETQSGDDTKQPPGAARERLQQLDLLQNEIEKIGDNMKESGYGEDIREEMDRLFENKNDIDVKIQDADQGTVNE